VKNLARTRLGPPGENEVIMPRRKFVSLLSVIGLVFLLAGLAQAAEFSAITVSRFKGDQEIRGKIYVKGDKTRADSSGPPFPIINITRLDKKIMWQLVPGLKIYAETPLDRQEYARRLDIPGEQDRQNLIGTEMLNGYETEKYALKSGPHQMARTVWFSKKLGIPLKVESADKSMVAVMKDIKEGGVDDSLFEIPAGYQKKTTEELIKSIKMSYKNIAVGRSRSK
jgi:outer membrane lipoprotein-sorting protein